MIDGDCCRGTFPIFGHLVNFCWFFFKWGLILGVIGVALAVPYLYRQVDEKICRHVEAIFADHYTGLEVTVRSAERVQGEGIVVRGLSVREPGVEGAGGELLRLDEFLLTCRTELQELATRKPEITQIVVRRMTVRATCLADGTCNATKLLPFPRIGSAPPPVTIQDGRVEIFDPRKGPTGILVLRDVNLTLTPTEASLQGGDDSSERKLQGTLSASHLGRVKLEGVVDGRKKQWSIGGVVEDMEISPELRNALPAGFAARLALLGSLRGQGELRFRVSHNPGAEAPLQFDVSGQLKQGRLNDPRLPCRLTDIRAAFHCNNDGFTIDNLYARSGQATLRLSCRRTGLDEQSPLTLEAEVCSST